MSELKPGLYATFQTTQGDITCQLFPDQAPKTVSNFVGLAGGSVEYVDAKTRQRTRGRFYDGLSFHRVIPNFMIQGGCPLGNGTGGPGFQFEDEFAKGLAFDRPGMLAMANAGPNTNGSQFFITVAPTTWLNNRHTIFGKVVEGQDVVEKISAVARDGQDRPVEPIILKSLRIEELT
ncbi:MAG: peptidylprolyl isomerase [Acidobacteria bacterium]|nr:peptidylprolyl isomerase [Acidobacteriota bacterium]